MASRTTSDRIPVPISYFISVQFGDIQLGSASLTPANKIDAHTPDIIQSLSLVKLNGMNWKTTANEEMNNIKNLKKTLSGMIFESCKITLSTASDVTLHKTILDFLMNATTAKSTTSVVKFRYGYVNGIKSYVYKGFVVGLEMSPDMYSLTVTLAANNNSNDEYTKFTKESLKALKRKFKKKQYKRYSDIAKDIASLQGWDIGRIEETTEVNRVKVRAPSKGATPQSYLKKVAKKAVSLNGEGKFEARFKFSPDGMIVFEFVPQTFISSAGYRAKKDYTFIYNMIPDGNVISFKPVMVDGTAIAGYYRKDVAKSKKKKKKKKKKKNQKAVQYENTFSVISTDTKQVEQITCELYNSDQDSSGLINADDDIVGVYMPNMGSIGSSSDLITYAEAMLKDNLNDYVYSVALNATATMEIVGDPELQQGDLINVLPMYPATSKSTGFMLHPSGGTYRIVGIEDNIGSTFTTSLTLVKETNTKKASSKKKKKKKKKKK